MRNIPPGALCRIELSNRPQPTTHTVTHPEHPGSSSCCQIGEQDFEHVGDGAFLHGHPTVHIGFAKRKLGVEANDPRCQEAVEFHRSNWCTGAVSVDAAVRPDGGQGALLDDLMQNRPEHWL